MKNFQKGLILFLIIFSNILMATDNDISVTIQTNKSSASSSNISVSYTNHTDNSVKMLKWNTLLEEHVSADLFSINLSNKKVNYVGRLVKRGTPKESDYIVFEPQESKTVDIDLSEYYKMDIEGNYAVSYKGRLSFSPLNTDSTSYKKDEQSTLKQKKIQSDFVQLNFIPTKKKSYASKITPSYNTCTSSEITTINNAHNQAISLAQTAYTAVNNANVPTTGERYVEWFGTSTSTRQTTVKNNLNAIYSTLDNQQLVFDCSCTDSVYAYVYPNDPYTVYLCNAFWTAPATGTDSQAGTLIHEVAHFDIVAGTDDISYGQTASRSLAISSPSQAITNSDSYEYFSENTPFLSMEESSIYTISGYVIDASTGDGINAAVVSLSNSIVNETTSTNSSGYYSFTNLSSSTYSVSATQVGYTNDSETVTITTGNRVANFNLLETSISSVDYKIVLSWGAQPSDLDSHLYIADPFNEGCLDQVYYADKVADGYASLDVDDRSSYGPETITITNIASTKNNEYWVNRFSSSPGFDVAGATVKLYRGSQLLKTFTAPQVDIKYWHVFDIGISGIVTVNTMHSTKTGTCAQSNLVSQPVIINYLLN